MQILNSESLPMSKQFQFRITQEEARQRLDVFLASCIGELSRMRIANLLAAGTCFVNQQAAKAGYHIAVDDLVEITLDDTVSTSMSAENIPLEILHEDEQIVILIKASGMLVHPNSNTKSGTLANALAYHLNRLQTHESNEETRRNEAIYNLSSSAGIGQESATNNQTSTLKNRQLATGNRQPVVRPGLVHRLDRATSGLMVVAKTQKALSLLTKHFHKRLVK